VSSALHWVDGETYGGAVRRGLRDTLGVNQRVAQNVGDATRYVFDIALALLPITPAGRARTLAQFERGSAKVLTKAGAEQLVRHPRKLLSVKPYKDFVGPFGDAYEAHHIFPVRYLKRYEVNPNLGPAIILTIPQHKMTRSWKNRCKNLPLNVPIQTEMRENIKDICHILRLPESGYNAQQVRQIKREMKRACEEFIRDHGSYFPH
jgi:hypothetical protein